MLDFVIQCFAVSMSIAVAIVFIYFCVKLLNYFLDSKQVYFGTVKVKKFLNEKTLVDVRLNDGKSIEGVIFKGFSEFGEHKDVPVAFRSWVVLDGPTGRIYLKPESIKVIITKEYHDA